MQFHFVIALVTFVFRVSGNSSIVRHHPSPNGTYPEYPKRDEIGKTRGNTEGPAFHPNHGVDSASSPSTSTPTLIPTEGIVGGSSESDSKEGDTKEGTQTGNDQLHRLDIQNENATSNATNSTTTEGRTMTNDEDELMKLELLKLLLESAAAEVKREEKDSERAIASSSPFGQGGPPEWRGYDIGDGVYIVREEQLARSATPPRRHRYGKGGGGEVKTEWPMASLLKPTVKDGVQRSNGVSSNYALQFDSPPTKHKPDRQANSLRVKRESMAAINVSSSSSPRPILGTEISSNQRIDAISSTNGTEVRPTSNGSIEVQKNQTDVEDRIPLMIILTPEKEERNNSNSSSSSTESSSVERHHPHRESRARSRKMKGGDSSSSEEWAKLSSAVLKSSVSHSKSAAHSRPYPTHHSQREPPRHVNIIRNLDMKVFKMGQLIVERPHIPFGPPPAPIIPELVHPAPWSPFRPFGARWPAWPFLPAHQFLPPAFLPPPQRWPHSPQPIRPVSRGNSSTVRLPQSIGVWNSNGMTLSIQLRPCVIIALTAALLCLRLAQLCIQRRRRAATGTDCNAVQPYPPCLKHDGGHKSTCSSCLIIESEKGEKK